MIYTKKTGFTLVELLISLAVLGLVIALVSQSYIQLSRIMRQIEVNRSLTVYASTIISSISTDMDDMLLKKDTTVNDSIVTLENPITGNTVSYTIKELDASSIKNIFNQRVVTGKVFDLSRRSGSNSTPNSFSNSLFTISDMHIEIIGRNDPTCSIPPSLKISMKVAYAPESINDNIRSESTIATVLTTPQDPALYRQTCIPSQNNP